MARAAERARPSIARRAIMGNRLSRLLPAAALVVLVAAVFGRIAGNQFVWWDDPDTIFRNPRLDKPSLAHVRHEWLHAEHGEYLPVTRSAWGLLALVAKRDTPDPDYLGVAADGSKAGAEIWLHDWAYHVASIAGHAVTALAVFALLRRLFGKPWAAFAGAALFAVHPVQVESVAWASGLKDVLCGMFAMLALWQYVAFVQDESVPGQARRRRYVVASFLFVLAILSKPTGVVTPVLALAIDGLLLRPGQWRKIARSLGPWFVISLIGGVAARSLMPSQGIPTTALWTRPLIVADTVAFYLWKLVWPAKLVVDYGRTPHWVMSHWWAYLIWLVPATIFGLCVWLAWRKGQCMPLAAGLLFVGGAAPVLGFTPHMFQYYSTTADHYLYQCMLGPGLLLAWGLTRVDWNDAAAAMRRRCVVGAVAAVLLALSARSVMQAAHWRDDRSFWTHLLAVRPASFGAHHAMGLVVMREKLGDAEPYFRRSIELNPSFARPHVFLAEILLKKGRLDESVAVTKRYIAILHTFPKDARPSITFEHYKLGVILAEHRRYSEAVEQFTTALRMSPSFHAAREGLEKVRRAEAAASVAE